jgi:hypothetical protein
LELGFIEKRKFYLPAEVDKQSLAKGLENLQRNFSGTVVAERTEII